MASRRKVPRPPIADPTGRAPDAPPSPQFSVSHLDRSVDPSTDFYRFASGGWVRRNPVPSDKVRWGAFDELLQRNFWTLRSILEEAAATPPGPEYSVARQVGDFYASALDLGRRNALGFSPIAPDLARIEAIDSVPALYRALAALERSGTTGGFLETYVYPDKRQSSVYAFYVDQGGLSLPNRDYYLAPEFEGIRTAYRSHLGRSFRALGSTPARAEAAVEAVVGIETALARASRTPTELRDEEKNYHRVEVADLAAGDAGTPWLQYLRDRELPNLPHLVVGQPEFLSALASEVRGRPLSEWKEYLRWHLLRGSAPYLHESAEAEWFDFFHRTLRGQEQPEPLWKRAALVIDDCLGEALGSLYVARAFPPEARARMAQLVDDLREVFTERLRSRDWMGEETRQQALAKFARFRTKIGHPDRFRDYSSIRVARDDFLGNVRRSVAFETHRQVARVGAPVDRDEWGMTPPTVNAYFSPVFNEIVFPAGILQPPFFDVTMDDAVNYGGIGAVIGHEITHGYDDQGRKFDADGNLRDWWTAQDTTEFQRRARRVVEEYNAFQPLPGISVNGQLTLGENLADLGGLSIAFEALQRRLAKDPGRHEVTDGFTPEQRFFLSFAQIWRQNCRDAEVRRRVLIDTHSPGEFRARGAVSNLGAFFDAFPIPAGSPMWRGPAERVSIW